jgi:8-oxo-dGTP diphosphatase
LEDSNSPLTRRVNGAAVFPAGDACGIWDGRRNHVHFFELRLDRLHKLHLDNREIIATRLITPDELLGVALTRPAAAYLGRTHPPACPYSAES